MSRNSTGPTAVFGIRIKSLIIAFVFFAVLLTVINWSEITSRFSRDNFNRQSNPEQAVMNAEKQHLIVDEDMLSKAMQEVEAEKLAELETGSGSVPTDRFFYIVELISGGDLGGVDLTINPDQVTLISEGGTQTTIKRIDVKKIHRYKLPPTPKEK